MSSRERLATLGLIAAAMLGSAGLEHGPRHRASPEPDLSTLTPEEKEARRRQLLVKKGHRVFVVEGVEILALNEKNARKKFQTLKVKPK